jgi:hypothetical protein
MEEVSMMRKEVSSSFFLMLFGIYFTVESYRFGLGTWARPGPGYFPFGAGLIFSIMSLSILVRSLRKVERNETPAEPAGYFQWQNIVLVVAGMFAFALLLKTIGFALCTFGLCVFFIRVIAKKGWPNSILTGLVIGLVFHVFFNIMLNAQLPNGLLKFAVE